MNNKSFESSVISSVLTVIPGAPRDRIKEIIHLVPADDPNICADLVCQHLLESDNDWDVPQQPLFLPRSPQPQLENELFPWRQGLPRRDERQTLSPRKQKFAENYIGLDLTRGGDEPMFIAGNSWPEVVQPRRKRVKDDLRESIVPDYVYYAQSLPALDDETDIYECNCCYNEVLFEDMVQCSEGHLFCMECLRRYTKEAVYGQFKSDLVCLSDGCAALFPTSQLMRALPEELHRQYEERIAQEALNLANLPNLIRCPFCNFQALLDEEQKIFACPNEKCRKKSCRDCGIDWKEHKGLHCNEIEKESETKLRLDFEEQMAKASIRTCPYCKANYTKESGCNKIVCRCGKLLCYVCRTTIKGYDHFCQHLREPQKPCNRCKLCFLWSNAEYDDNLDIKHIKQTANQERIKQGFKETKEIGVPASPKSRNIPKAEAFFVQVDRPIHNRAAAVPIVPVPAVEAPVPEVRAPVPTVQAPIPEVRVPVPTVQAPIPKVQASVPKVRAQVPKVQGAIPKVQGAIPKIQGVAPKVQGVVPKVQGVILKVQATVPAVTVAVPKVQNSVPAVQAAVPKEKRVRQPKMKQLIFPNPRQPFVLPNQMLPHDAKARGESLDLGPGPITRGRARASRKHLENNNNNTQGQLVNIQPSKIIPGEGDGQIIKHGKLPQLAAVTHILVMKDIKQTKRSSSATVTSAKSATPKKYKSIENASRYLTATASVACNVATTDIKQSKRSSPATSTIAKKSTPRKYKSIANVNQYLAATASAACTVPTTDIKQSKRSSPATSKIAKKSTPRKYKSIGNANQHLPATASAACTVPTTDVKQPKQHLSASPVNAKSVSPRKRKANQHCAKTTMDIKQRKRLVCATATSDKSTSPIEKAKRDFPATVTNADVEQPVEPKPKTKSGSNRASPRKYTVTASSGSVGGMDPRAVAGFQEMSAIAIETPFDQEEVERFLGENVRKYMNQISLMMLSAGGKKYPEAGT